MLAPRLQRILLAAPRSFCAGVDRAIQSVESALAIHGAPVWVRKEIVHNRTVVDGLESRGVRFVEGLEEIPDGGVCIFSAHGVSPAVREAARRRGLRVIDATCPLVTKVHLEVLRFVKEGFPVVLIGHARHEETEGTLGEAPGRTHLVERPEDVAQLPFPADAEVRYCTQTTLSVDDTAEVVRALQQRYPRAAGPRKDDICYATQNRQNAAKALANRADTVLVLGASNSSNTLRLVEVIGQTGTVSHRIATGEEVMPEMVASARVIGITAGASTPECLVQSLIDRLQEGRTLPVESLVTAEENVRFVLPAAVRASAPL